MLDRRKTWQKPDEAMLAQDIQNATITECHPMKEHPYASFLHHVEKPARYIGGEYNSIVKHWDDVDVTMALCFPDLYDIGMSHLGTKILYSIINKSADLCAERCYCPWPDMEEALRSHELPLLSLETHRPLKDFDVVGFSLQYEMTFTNVLTMMDLGGIPLHADKRTLDDPLIIAGGPVATQPEPMSPFIDVFLVGDAEERLPRLLRHYKQLKQEGQLTRTEILIELAKEGGLYCPALYERELCERSSLMYVARPKYDGVPEFVERAFLDDIGRYAFPDDSPVAVAEAIFDRMSIEISRGCTEGCRFCQAGMIYRPVRERGPDEIVDTLLSALEKGGYDEAAITSLSTADYSCINPLISKLMDKLRRKKVSLGISSLRAYGLDENMLDEIASVKATGLTFAPEAGSQRMRDVINKNITEDDIYTTCHRVFSRGWNKMKLYFIIGLPTEEEDDIMGIAKMGRQAYEIGKLYQKNRLQVVVSVSSHVPKPHTPFQWAAMDTMEQIDAKQDMLRSLSKKWKFKFRHHEKRISHLEGIVARGDTRTSWLIEEAWRRGARFDGWDEHLKRNWDIWQETLEAWEAHQQIDRSIYLRTLPLDGHLPWEHIDVGLTEGFLAKEYKKSLGSKLSPPCGKPNKAQVHHTNLQDALGETRKLVCYHCGIACDLDDMKQKRIDYLTVMGAEEPVGPKEGNNARENALERIQAGKTPHDFKQGERKRYRLRYTKLNPVSLQGHQDLLRIIPRIMHRGSLPIFYSEGFSPKPVLSFGPALSLGIQALNEYVDIALTEHYSVEDLLALMNLHAPNGLHFTGVRQIREGQDRGISKCIRAKEYGVLFNEAHLQQLEDLFADDTTDRTLFEKLTQRCEEIQALEEIPITVHRKKKSRTLDLKDTLLTFSPMMQAELPEELQQDPERLALRLTVKELNGPSIRPAEMIQHLFGVKVDLHQIVRVGCWNLDEDENITDPLHAGLLEEERDTYVATCTLSTARLTQQSKQSTPTTTLTKPLTGTALQDFLQDPPTQTT
tara:strand:+ start:1185 stop:4238 length:3054 start_codon:yes stop_codon:yes gene_type:complete